MGSLKITESRRFRIQAANRRLFWSFHVRDVGVAVSNPVTPTIDFHIFLSSRFSLGPTFKTLWVPDWVPRFVLPPDRAARRELDV